MTRLDAAQFIIEKFGLPSTGLGVGTLPAGCLSCPWERRSCRTMGEMKGFFKEFEDVIVLKRDDSSDDVHVGPLRRYFSELDSLFAATNTGRSASASFHSAKKD